MSDILAKFNCHLPYISECKSHESIFRFISTLGMSKVKGNAFEIYCKYFLMYDELLASKVDKVWLFDEFPIYLKMKFKLPTKDMGIDIVVRTKNRKYWLVQCKYRSNYAKSTRWSNLSTFESRALMTKHEYPTCIERCILMTTCYECPEHYRTHSCFSSFSYERLVESKHTLFALQRWKKIFGRSLPSLKKTPRPYQNDVRDRARAYFRNCERGTFVLPCGSGKTIMSVWCLKDYVDNIVDPFVLVVLPRLDLVGYYLYTFLSEYPFWGKVDFTEEGSSTSPPPSEGKPWKTLVAASDVDVSDNTISGRFFDISLKETEWDKYFRKSGPKAVFVTLQSVPKFHMYLSKHKLHPHFTVIDEAHLTAGAKNKAIGPTLDPDTSCFTKILFLTATPKIICVEKEQDNELLKSVNCMSNTQIYGHEIVNMNFRELYELGLNEEKPYLTDYKVQVLLGITKEKDYNPSRYVIAKMPGENLNMLHSNLAGLSMISKAYKSGMITHTLAYCNRVEDAKLLCHIARDTPGLFTGVQVFFVHGGQPVRLRKQILREYQKAKKIIIFNAQLLRFGTDLPRTNCIVFCSEVTSVIDIIQMIMRGCRVFPGKEFFHILLPFVCDDSKGFFNNQKGFSIIRRVLTALSEIDFAMRDEWLAMQQGMWSSKYSNSRRLQVLSEKILEEDDMERWLSSFEMACISGDTLRNHRWHERFILLKDYIAIKGECPPKRATQFRKELLGRWVWDQRKLYTDDKLMPYRFHKLESLGKVWSWNNPLKIYEKKVLDNCRPYLEDVRGHTVNNIQMRGDIKILVLASNRPDTMQLQIQPKYNKDGKHVGWERKSGCRHSPEIASIFEEGVSQTTLFGGKIPPIFNKKITSGEWKTIRCEFPEFANCYIDCPSTVMAQLYAAKGYHYVQIQEKGLYHLGLDLLRLGVPLLQCPQQFRIRVKDHSKGSGFSVTVACKFKKNGLTPSPFSLDKKQAFPCEFDKLL